MKKPNIRKQIKESSQLLREVMAEGLGTIAGNLIAQIMKKARTLPESKLLDATKDLKFKGEAEYKKVLLEAMAMIASDSLAQAQKETKTKVKLSQWKEKSLMLGEFESLPSSVKKRLYRQMQLLLGAQIADVEKILYFQYGHSIASTDSMDMIQKDLEDAAEEYVSGASISTGATTITSQVVNEARSAYFFNDEVLEQIDAFQFVNGDPVSPICQDLAGTIFSKNDPGADRYQPPLHFNCKSYIVPILKGNLNGREVEDLKPSTKDLEKTIQFHEGDHGK